MATTPSSTKTPFDVKLTFKGKTANLSDVSSNTTVEELYTLTRAGLNLNDDNVSIKLLHKGKVIGQGSNTDSPAFPNGLSGNSAKIIVMATNNQKVEELNAGRSDPTIRGFDHEKLSSNKSNSTQQLWWGPNTSQHRHYKFVRFEACTWQSFGHRTGSTTPHAFEAMRLLEKLATDPGVVAVMVERELVVNTLGEMDPIDDRIMQKKASQGSCLLGYNTNHGLRIDLKLRTDDLKGFRPYRDIVTTLLHELSHNWVGEHNALFWSNYGQMYVEYLYEHSSLSASGFYINGRTSADLAGVNEECKGGIQSITEAVITHLTRETKQHGVPMSMVTPAVLDRCREITESNNGVEGGRKLGGSEEGTTRQNQTENVTDGKRKSARELALAAAERRAREQEKSEERNKKS